MKLTLVNVSEGFAKGQIPLGLCYIASYLKKYGNYNDIRILDSNTENIYENLKSTDIVGISSVTQDFERAKRFARFVKEQLDVPVIIGGVHISTLPKLPEPFDVGVIGEGEQTMLELMEVPEFSVKYLKKIKGLCYSEDNITKITQSRELIDQLDSVPIPNMSLVNMGHYLKKQCIIPYYRGRSLTILTTRGCPYRCAFCSTSHFWKRYREFSAARVVEEIKHLIKEYKIEILQIFDDHFLTNKKRFEKIVSLIKEEDINEKIKIMCLARADSLDENIMKKLKEINVVVIGIGLESGCNKILQYLKNGTTTVQDNERAVELCKKYKIVLMGSFMVGNPYENIEDLMETLRFIRKYRNTPYLAPLSYISTPFPGTKFWEYAQSKGILLDDYENYCMDIPDNIEALKKAPLLADIPLEKFFCIAQEFRKENESQWVKGAVLQATPLILLKMIIRYIYKGKNPMALPKLVVNR